jgi:hypothetical protein
MNPDFHRLAPFDSDLAELASERIAMSDLALEAHRLEEMQGTPIDRRFASSRASAVSPTPWRASTT